VDACDVELFVSVWAATKPKEVRWYDTDHYFKEEARRDREEWLEKQLK
jgi:hypothetical protein